MANEPGFVKFFFPDTSSERLPLPVAFSEILGDSTPGVAYLRNSDGQKWQVTLAKEGDNWYFQDGWKDLVQTINAEARDLFSFDLASDGVFDFKLFGANRCNKPTSWGQKEQVGENEEAVDKGKTIVEDDDTEEIEDFDDQDAEPKKIKKDITKNGKDAIPVNNEPTRRRNYRHRRTIAEEEEIFKHGVISRPENPHFIAKVYETKPRDLNIPREVVDYNKLKLPETMVLIDENNIRWEGEVSYWKDSRIWVLLGWKAFCRWNVVKPEDKCLCECILGEDGQQVLYVKMRLLRGGSWLPQAATQEA